MPPSPKVPNPAEISAEPAPADPPPIELDARSFNRAERLEVQQALDVEFSDVLTFLFSMIDPNRTGAMPFALVDRDGLRHFGDEVLQLLVWVQAKRTDPTVELSTYDNVELTEFTSAYVQGILKKVGAENMKSEKS